MKNLFDKNSRKVENLIFSIFLFQRFVWNFLYENYRKKWKILWFKILTMNILLEITVVLIEVKKMNNESPDCKLAQFFLAFLFLMKKIDFPTSKINYLIEIFQFQRTTYTHTRLVCMCAASPNKLI